MDMRTAQEVKEEKHRRERQIVGIVCARIFDAKAAMKMKKNDIWRVALLCDLIYYDWIARNRAEIQNRTGIRLLDVVISYENRDYLEVIDVPQEYSVGYRRMNKETGELHPEQYTSGVFYTPMDAARHLKHLNELQPANNFVCSRILIRDAFCFDESDPEAEVRPGKWRMIFNNIHEQVVATHPKHGDIEVDAGMKQFLEALWELGYETAYSCEHGKGRGPYIVFEDLKNAERFVNQFGGRVDDFKLLYGRRSADGFTIPDNIQIYRPNKT